MGIFSIFHACSCEKFREGALYCTPGEKGGYGVLKILKLDEAGVHVRLYSNHFAQIPERIDESQLYMAGMDHKPDEKMGMGHMPVSRRSFAGWHALFIQKSHVTEEELEGYKMWLEAKGGYF